MKSKRCSSMAEMLQFEISDYYESGQGKLRITTTKHVKLTIENSTADDSHVYDDLNDLTGVD